MEDGGGGGEGEGRAQVHAQTLVEAALEVLNAADPVEKARLGEAAATRWLQGAISISYHPHLPDPPPPHRPARLSNVLRLGRSLDDILSLSILLTHRHHLASAGEAAASASDAQAGQGR